MKKTLIIGASGVVSSELKRILESQGVSVRGTTSKPLSTTKEDLVQVNLSSGDGLEEAFIDIDQAFFMSPSGYADQYQILSKLIQKAIKHKLKKVVLMTAMGANAVETSPMRKAEIELENSGLNYNIIRPNWFFQNFHTFWIDGILQHQKIMLPAGTASVSFIDTRDIAAVAAKLLTSSEYDNQAFDLTGAKAYTHAEVAEALSKVTQKTISYHDIPPEDLRQGLLAAGLPKDYAEFLIIIFGFLKEGYSARVENSVNRLLGSSPKTLNDYIQTYKSQWIK